MAETIRIDPVAHAALSEIAREKKLSLTEALSNAVEAYRRQEFFAGLASDYATLRSNDGAWTEEQEERRAWDAASFDDLEDE